MQSSLQRLAFPLTLSICTLSALAVGQQAQPIGQLYASDASVKGSVMLAGSGTSVLSGSSIEAGTQAATLKLERGGSLLVCEGTKLSVTSSQNGRQLLLSLNTGNLELNYPLGTEADTLLTPDLRLLMPGPGTVHVAVRVAPNGDTCVQSLPWNAAAVVVSESMGDDDLPGEAGRGRAFQGWSSEAGQPLQHRIAGVRRKFERRSESCAGAPVSSTPAPAAATLPPPSQPQTNQQLASAPPARATHDSGRAVYFSRRRPQPRFAADCADSEAGEHQDRSAGADRVAASV